ncbi:hypothetical protein GCM10010276_12500 [Streptomyces longisporus]|uniref:Uncharacterized protein n=1 Tax=Streptomyces longisporus TaxID=1948 RepID=A0ABP5YFC1_STRLO
MKPRGEAITVTPPTSASEHSPERTAWAAMCRATSEEEHAVSMDTAGPCRPSRYEMRPDITLAAPPVVRCPSMPSTLRRPGWPT